MTADTLLDVRGLRAGYLAPVLGPLSFALARGEVLGLCGPNGCGKSTLLAALLGNVRIFAGDIRRAPGAVFSLQTQRQPPVAGVPLTGAELLALTGAAAAGLPPALAACLPLRLDRLSGGQRQFLHLWACLQAPADVVLLDEPTNNLDPDGVAALAGALRARAAGGAGLLVVSHDAAFLAAACDRLLRLGGVDDAA
ncbi:ABC transporter ATP-binding protein [Azospira restricta]|uniref:ATP-binding cassette domain-containing protein n=1 Tax=Azospira restricta TaxID=404405 RepID=A0A974SR18_9RHOO|nr:ABC transporter ATP-binding protein [Azospira restricta]QRJ64832.1 ATP-binding cassette domain-containing protein [Azospira restricta]